MEFQFVVEPCDMVLKDPSGTVLLKADLLYLWGIADQCGVLQDSTKIPAAQFTKAMQAWAAALNSLRLTGPEFGLSNANMILVHCDRAMTEYKKKVEQSSFSPTDSLTSPPASSPQDFPPAPPTTDS